MQHFLACKCFGMRIIANVLTCLPTLAWKISTQIGFIKNRKKSWNHNQRDVREKHNARVISKRHFLACKCFAMRIIANVLTCLPTFAWKISIQIGFIKNRKNLGIIFNRTLVATKNNREFFLQLESEAKFLVLYVFNDIYEKKSSFWKKISSACRNFCPYQITCCPVKSTLLLLFLMRVRLLN